MTDKTTKPVNRTATNRHAALAAPDRSLLPAPIRGLSVRQPWAWLIAQGYKNVENRVWPTRYRGLIAIHAALQVHADYHQGTRFPIAPELVVPPADQIERGGIVAVAELVDCVTASASPWFSGPYGFVLHNVQPVPFIPLRGMLNLFTLPPDVEARLRELVAGASA